MNYQSKEKTISKAVISRLPRYYRYLHELIEEGVERISSEELSKMMKATASQIRQDLNHFGGFGQQGYGYNVKSLYNEIGKILGVEQSHNLIGIGAGNLGRALVRYQGFPDHGFTFKALFDVDEQLCGKSVNGIKIRHIDDVGLYPVDNTLDIIALCVPREIAKHVASSLYEKGFRNFWNFAQTELALPADANVKNVHLLDSLLEFSYTISTKEDKNE